MCITFSHLLHSAEHYQIPGLLEIDVGAAFGLDLVVGVSAAIDLEAGVSLTLPELAFVEVSLLTNEIVNSNL